MADDAVKKLEERLTRLEAALSQQGGGAAGFTPGGAVVDPAPWGGGGGWGWGWRWPHPVVDPAAFFHRPVVDPAVFPHPVVDPAPWTVRPAVATAAAFGRIGPVGGDPPPPDISRFSAAQLQAALHSIAAEKARLDSMEALIKQHLDKAKQPG